MGRCTPRMRFAALASSRSGSVPRRSLRRISCIHAGCPPSRTECQIGCQRGRAPDPIPRESLVATGPGTGLLGARPSRRTALGSEIEHRGQFHRRALLHRLVEGG